MGDKERNKEWWDQVTVHFNLVGFRFTVLSQNDSLGSDNCNARMSMHKLYNFGK